MCGSKGTHCNIKRFNAKYVFFRVQVFIRREDHLHIWDYPSILLSSLISPMGEGKGKSLSGGKSPCVVEHSLWVVEKKVPRRRSKVS